MKEYKQKKRIVLGKLLIFASFLMAASSFCWFGVTKAAPAYVSLMPQRDKFVENGAGIDTYYMRVGKFDGICVGVLGFDISDISGAVTSAVLKINVNSLMYFNDQYWPATMNIYGSNTDDWLENGASIPSKDVSILSSQVVDKLQTYSYDVTGYVQSQTDGYATFVLDPVTTSVIRYLNFASSENGSGATLEINYRDPVATLSSSALTETNLNGSTVNITLEDTTFADSVLNKDSFTLTGINGLGISGVNYVDQTHCTVTLAYDGRDFDANTSLSVAIDNAELTTLHSLQASNSLTVTAVNDAESLSLADDGLINEGSEDGEVITVTLSGGQFAPSINPNNWTLGNLPAGVSRGSVTRINDTTVRIALSGNATYDYDVDITNMSVSCTTEEYRDSTGGGTLTCSTGVRFIAHNDIETLTLLDSGNITENYEHDKTFIAILSGGQFANTLNRSNWVLSGQPYGVWIGSVERLSDTQARVTLYGLTQVDYDTDMIASLSISAAEYSDSTGNGTLSGTGVTFHATNDPELFYIQSYNSQIIYEGQENGKLIWAMLSGGKWPWIVNPAHWSLGGLPDGVTASVEKDQYYTPGVNIILSGNATQDYDSNKTMTVTCSTDGYSDSRGKGPLTYSRVMFTAVNDPESISISDDGLIAEGAEDGESITVTLTGGTFPETLHPDSWAVDNLPAGVTKGAVTRVDSHTVQITLSGNAEVDYDSDITDVSVTCGVSEYNDSTGGGPLTCNTGVRLVADNDVESLSIEDDGLIEEGLEDGEVITATLTGGIFSSPINADHWTVTGLPDGVSKGTVTRVDNHHVTIRLSGNATADYDSDFSNVTVTCTSDEYSGTLRISLSASGVTIHATKDAETISISNSDTIIEGAEDGKTINVTLSGGQFVHTLNPANWTVGNLPKGVTKGVVTRMGGNLVTITLSGNANGDYDSDILDVSVTCGADEYVDNTGGGPLTCNTGVRLEAVNDAESLLIADDGLITEGEENGEIVTVTLTGGVYADTIHAANWSIEGQPEGVSIGAVTRVDDHTVAIRLIGIAQVDYDSDITSMRVTCAAEEYEDSSGVGPLTSSTGVRFTAVNDIESITISDDGLITEGAENGEVLRVTLSGGIFSSTLRPENWTVTGLPLGVEKAEVIRLSRHQVAITLSGNADVDYDANITNVAVSCTSAEYSGSSGATLTADTGVTLTAVNDLESLFANAVITEGAEDGSVITVKINGGSFNTTIHSDNWIVSGLPMGVEKGAVRRIDSRTVSVSLMGNAVYDYDSDISLLVTCTADEYTGTLRTSLTAEGSILKAVDDAEALSLTDSGIKEGAENGETITVTITGGQFDKGIDPSCWTVDNLPAGVSVGSVKRMDAHTVVLTLNGNASLDYDEDLIARVTCEAGQYHAGTTPLCAQGGVVFRAVIERKPDASPLPSVSPSSIEPTPPIDNNLSLKAAVIEKNKNAGTMLIEIDVADLPTGTAFIQLASGKQIDIGGIGGKVRLEISGVDLNEKRELVLVALNGNGIPLASFHIEADTQLLTHNGDGSTVLWVIGALGLAGFALVICLVWRRRG